jgi:hypothetical protein
MISSRLYRHARKARALGRPNRLAYADLTTLETRKKILRLDF